jgi:dienelactone hydrolase
MGVVVLGGSSGAVPVERARLIAALGVQAIALRWFGGPDQSPGICEIPLETIESAIDRLARAGCQRFALVGTSKGAEAALLLGSLDTRIDLVVALSPSAYVWANVGPGLDGFEWPPRSSFTWRGEPLPFVPHDAEDLLSVRRIPPVRYLDLFTTSLGKHEDKLAAATLPVERARALILAAGADDQLWPSARFAQTLARRREAHGMGAKLIIHPRAGHRILLPSESMERSRVNAHGGTDAADADLGALAWEEFAAWVG